MQFGYYTGACRKALAKATLAWSYRLYRTAGRLAPDGHPARVFINGQVAMTSPARETMLASLSTRAELAVYTAVISSTLYCLDIVTPWFSLFPGVATLDSMFGIGM